MKWSIFLFSLVLCLACKENDETRMPDTSYNPDIRPELFLTGTNITHPYFPMTDGRKYIYEGQTEDGLEHIEEQRKDSTRLVQGIECVVVNFKAYLNGVLIEEADDWYAQANDGTVWYFGEEVDNYDQDGQLLNHDGSWEAGIDGAKAGIIMPAEFTVGFRYREEYYFNEAEDEAEITGINLSQTIPFGTFSDCLRTKNWTELEPDVVEEKYYASGVGLIREVNTADAEEIFLIGIE